MTKEKDNFADVAKNIEDELPHAAPEANAGAAQCTPEPPKYHPAQPSGQEGTATKKRGKKEGAYQLKYSTGVKTLAFVAFLLMATIASACVFGMGAMLENNFYTSSKEAVQEAQFEAMVDEYLPVVIAVALKDDDYQALDAYCLVQNIAVEISDADGETLISNAAKASYDYSFSYKGYALSNTVPSGASGTLADALLASGTVLSISFTPDSSWSNSLSVANALIENGYDNRYLIILNCLLAVGVGMLCFFYLFGAAGRSPRGGQVALGGWTNIPFDALTLLTVVFVTLPIVLCSELHMQSARFAQWQLYCLNGLCALAIVAVLLLFLLNIAVRCKLGDLWRNTVVFLLCRFVWRRLKKLVGWVVAHTSYFFAQLPFIWKGVVILPVLVVFNVAWFWLCAEVLDSGALYLAVLFVQFVLLMGGYLYFLLALNRLAEGGRALAAGDLDYQVDTSQLHFELKEHAENINRMGGCLTEAVNEQLKSERMKTELITNVSHDIKTPLTSIVNYADLLSKEETDNDKIAEYTEVISRQSRRLKRLIEDLVEASKASTGNLEVSLIPCEVGVLLSQAVGEYQQRLDEKALTLVAKLPETPLAIMADGRHLWRVFDNLLGNIYKYAQEGTRVYLSLEQQGDKAMLTFKNISKYPLDISAEELMERFVRGDAARHDEGNGLGLSIAQSLAELQRGSLSLHVDGDLFKVVLLFDLVEMAAE